LSFLIVAVVAGCDRSKSRSRPVEHDPSALPWLICEAEREHDFGAVIATSGRKLEHRYRLVNATKHAAKIVDIINRKTCCGTIRGGPRMLHPGEAMDVEVTLHVGDRFGQVVHIAEVVSDFPGQSSLLLRTTADAVTPVRIGEDLPFNRTILLGTREPRQVAFRAHASGTSTEPPVDLDRLELRSTIRVGWSEPKEVPRSNEGLRDESRRFIAVLDPTGPPGERRAEIALQRGETVYARHVVDWEVASALTVSPKVIVVRASERDYRLVIRSLDQRPFRIERIECSLPGMRFRALSTIAALTQKIHGEGVAPSKIQRGTATVFTDHPAQQRIEVPLVMID
jgi:hypothetical protein